MQCAAGVLFSMLCGAVVGPLHAQTSFIDETYYFGPESEIVALEFEVSEAADLTVTATDFGTMAATPPPLSALHVAIARGSEQVLTLTGAGSDDFAATPGIYKLVIIGRPSGPGSVGSVGVDIAAGGFTVFQTVQAFESPAPPTASPAVFEHSIEIAAADTYQLTLTDFGLPTTLAALELSVVPPGGSPMTNLSGAGVVSFAANPGTYDVFVYAELAPGAERGLVGIEVRRPTAGMVFSAIDELGTWPYRYAFDVGAPTTLTATLTDLAFPQPLATLGGVLAGNGLQVATLGAGSASGAALEGGQYVAYVEAVPPSASVPGSFGLRVVDASGAALVDTVRSVVPDGVAMTDTDTFEASFEIAQAGDYTLTLTDFGLSGFFDAFTSITLALTSGTTIVDTLDAAGGFTFAAAPGTYSIAVIADPAGTNGNGLLGIAVVGGPSSDTVYETTAAIGTSFVSRKIEVAGATSVDVEATDLAFPGAFEDLRIAVTRGAARVTEIVGGGAATFDATPGTYFVNLLATPDTTTQHSTLGLLVDITPSAPTLLFTSSATSVAAGGSATLTWAATDATSCTASGAWSGTRTAAASETVGPLNANSTFTLNCTGAGGSVAASVTIGITAEQRSGGGGSTGFLSLLTLIVCARRRRAQPRAA